METLKNYLKTAASTHVFGIALAGCIVFAGRSWLAEHDARLQAEQTIKTAQAQVADLQKQKEAVAAQATVQLKTLQKQAAEVKTAPQAIAELPKVAPPALQVRELPDAPSAVSVQAVPLYEALNQAKQDAVGRAACEKELDIQEKTDAQKDTEITALKKSHGFWKQLKRDVVPVAIAAGAGYALGKR